MQLLIFCHLYELCNLFENAKQKVLVATKNSNLSPSSQKFIQLNLVQLKLYLMPKIVMLIMTFSWVDGSWVWSSEVEWSQARLSGSSEGEWEWVRVSDGEWEWVRMSEAEWGWVRMSDEWGRVRLLEIITSKNVQCARNKK